MNRSVLIGLACCLGLLGCTQAGGGATTVAAAPAAPAAPAAAQPATTEAPIDRWDALRPDEVTYQRPPPQIGLSRNGMDGVGGLIDDTGSGTPPGQEIDHSSPDRAKQFGSSRVVDAVDGRAVDLDGYVVPLGTNDAGLVEELLFVPFYGACIHVPPPPPNQIIHVTLATPIALGDLWDPYRLAGRLQVKRFDADIASASYDAAAATLTAIHD
ncbi:DUF3299 domain-containing protein [Stenotrophomonas maltophilia]|uniref:DUF3299 domain-containing protein n=1 Tax=Stenotrophomonas maltophilia TaxID=40324 RepID=UPI0015E03041|nr:DUF3299 domain-containing protein [Stenotrophomonas maltophilia]ELN2584518.1 DUF3299 domain-containing protein [Stenotrophomonas maltophilia]ELN2592242.1 DUF3299 domain-containing protein [Stenotrophomonas maltophilia]MBA0300626.1 DUF3299 domain-containing protein [Stenotrophomonas maltophilia]MBH1402519.1 DUF3299 domain-containing protein [Stenotrophomonas maltophilia]MBH1704222.1 DUF3299 domain-containing protein [Stenotrophomonas maltophilia]